MTSPFDPLFSPSVRFILLKGQPGTGKTTLAIELLAMHGRGMYVSTRVSLDLLSRQNVRLRELFQEGKVFEYYNKGDEKNAEFGFEDNRLGSAKEIMQSILGLAASEKGNKNEEQLVVLDSWDAIAGIMDPIERKKSEHALLAIADANNIRLVFVSETETITDSDYMVDAIVQLEDAVLDNKRTRRIVWKKIRGQEIPERSSLYSLHNGAFTVFTSDSRIALDYSPRDFPTIPHGERLYSCGSKDMDDLLFGGGLTHGSMIALELDSNVSTIWQLRIGLSFQLNFITNGGCSVLFPTSELSASMAKKRIAMHLPEHDMKDSLRIVTGNTTEINDPCYVQLDRKSVEKSLEGLFDGVMTMKKGVSGRTNRPCFYYLSVDAIESLFGVLSGGPNTSMFGSVVKQFGDVALLVVSSGSRMAKATINSSDLHLKLIMVDGSPVIYAAKPPSPHFFHFGFDLEAGYPQVRLTPIV